MTTTVKHVLLAISTVSLYTGCCKDNDPCEENPNSIFCQGVAGETGGTDGETGGAEETGGVEELPCAPLNDGVVGYEYACQGTGNGWLSLKVYPVGTQPPECVNWGDGGKPESPSTDDCVPLDLGMLPSGIPSPGACCSDAATSDDIVEQCEADCGYAACKLAIDKLRDAALGLPENGPEGVVRDDLFFFAGLLEMPAFLNQCATKVSDAGGELIPIALGAGSSDPLVFGHVENATLYLQCALDPSEPFATSGATCDAPPNLPIVEEESSMGGVAALGAISLFGPDGDASTSLYDISFEFRETYNRDGSIDFLLTDFGAKSLTTSYGTFMFDEPSLRLVGTASGSMVGETVTFPAGALRIEATAAISSNGEILFDGARMSGEYVNTEDAIAIRRSDGAFAFVEATFKVDDYEFVLNTESGTALPR